jgi:hypothetical protein
VSPRFLAQALPERPARDHKPRGYWSEARLRAEAARHASLAGFMNVIGKSGYEAMRKLGLLRDLTSSMHKQIGRERLWTIEKLQAEAAKYQHRVDFFNKSKGAYQVAWERGLLDIVCAHMQPKSRRIWTPERITAEARRFATRITFMRQSGSAYNAARQLGILDDVCRHMRSDNHLRHWSDAKIYAEAIKYTKVRDFYRGSPNAYEAAKRWGIFDEVCAHMSPRKLPAGHWTEDRIRAEALRYQTRSAFDRGSAGAAHAARHRLGIYEAVCAHMPESAWQPPPQVPRIWTRERIFMVAQQFLYLGDFQRACSSAYNAARKQGLLIELRARLPTRRRPPGSWTPEMIRAEALRYNSRSAFLAHGGGCANAAKRLHVYEDICREVFGQYELANRERWRQRDAWQQAALRVLIDFGIDLDALEVPRKLQPRVATLALRDLGIDIRELSLFAPQEGASP